MFLQLLPRSYTREHEEVRRINRRRRDDDLFVTEHLMYIATILDKLHSLHCPSIEQ